MFCPKPAIPRFRGLFVVLNAILAAVAPTRRISVGYRFRLAGTIVLAFGMIAIAPGATTVAQRYLDGVPLRVVWSTFGGLACAEECEDSDGDPRQCTHWEEFMNCRDAAWDSHSQCRRDGGSWLKCEAILGVDLVACAFDFLTGLVLD